MDGAVSIVWFRNDLRLDDNPALAAASERGVVVPVFVQSASEKGDPFAQGGASRWWLHQSLVDLSGVLEEAGSRLVIEKGDPARELYRIAEDAGASAVFWNRRYDPAGRDEERRVLGALQPAGLHCEDFDGALLFGPESVRTGRGDPFRLFTPFWSACRALTHPLRPKPRPRSIDPPAVWPVSRGVGELGLLDRHDWTAGIRAAWVPGERGALDVLAEFAGGPIDSYAGKRDRPDVRGTSRLSPHLHFGEVSARRVWHEISDRGHPENGEKTGARDRDEFLRQLGWREFAHHLLFHFPHTAGEPLRREFSGFPWREDPNGLDAWRRGKTGFPFVDAGMRELWTTGWMHNRTRMVAASFLVKDLLIDWVKGASWFWDTLVDADLANNTLGWQWTSGCGVDAAPFFRVFNPVLQGEKFDPDGAYIRRWIPELGGLPARWIHRPWEAPGDVLGRAGVALGKMYPRPIVDHRRARERALAALESVRGTP